MEFKGEQLIKAPRESVWRSLNDPEMLRACVPGCESLVARTPDEFDAVVVAAVGPVKAKFKGSLTLFERAAPSGYRIAGKGGGGIAGFGKMQAQVTLTEQDGGTLLSYTAEAQVGGKLAQIGARLVSSVANKMADEFFLRFNNAVSARDAQ